MNHPHLFSPLRVGTFTVANRVFLPPHEPRLPPERQLRYLEERVKHGLGLMIVSSPSVNGVNAWSAGPPATPPSSYVGSIDLRYPDAASDAGAAYLDDLFVPQLRRQAELAHRYGIPCLAQVSHLGAYAIIADMQAGISPSGLPDEMVGEQTHALTHDEIDDIVVAFGHGAARVRAAGFDGVELHACNGLLLNSFMSPLTNRRTDEYGGSLENRVRIVRRIVEHIRERIGRGATLGLRIPPDEFVPGGLTTDDMIRVVQMLREHIDYVSCSSSSEPGRKFGITVPVVPSSDYPQAILSSAAAKLKAALDLPILVTGRITDPDVAEQVIAEGRADMIGMVRAQIADPEWVAKVRDGRVGELRRCTGDNEGCRARTQVRTKGGSVTLACTVNAAVGREEEMEITPSATPRRVLVVGGGPGGMEAARVAALRGHEVVLCEQSEQLGGQVLTAALDPRSGDLVESIRFLAGRVAALDVDVRFGLTVTADEVARLAPDVVILATGAVPRIPDVPGIDSPNVFTVADVLHDRAQLGQRVCIVSGLDGYRTSGNVAELLVERGHEVELITERIIVAENQDPAANHFLHKRLFEKNVGMHTLTGLAAVRDGGVVLVNSLTRDERALDGIDSVVISGGGAPVDGLLSQLRPMFPKGSVMAVGDCLAPRRVLHAVLEGCRAGLAC